MASQITHKGKTADSVFIVNAADIVSSGPTVITLGTFQATADGTGYLSGDIVIYQQEPPALPAYINTRTGAVITPNGSDIGPVGGASSAVTVSNFPATQTVGGTVAVSNQPVSIEVSNFPSINEVEGTVSVDNFPTTQTIEGTVAVSNQPASIEVSNFPPINEVEGTVSVDNFPTTQSVSGTVNVGNLPATQTVSGTVAVSNFPTTQTVSGTVGIGNFPATQTVGGTVAVSNHPSSIQVSNFPVTQPVSGTVSVGNLPATQTVAGTVAVSNHPTSTEVSNFPATQTVAGNVGITNFPTTQTVTGTVEISNLSATSTQYTEGDTDATITGTAILWEKAGNELSTISAANPLPVTGSLSVSNTVALAVFRALATGTGYSTGNIIVLRQTPPAAPEYYNATTNAVIAAPTPAHLGPIASSSNVVVDNFPAEFQVSNFPATQPVSGTITANAGTNLNTSALALEAGNLATIATNTASGTAITGATIPAGGVGRIGWLSAIWQQISTKLPALASGRVPVEISPLTATNFASQADVQAVRDRLISGGPAIGAGTAAAAQRTTLASDSPGVASLTTIATNTAQGAAITGATMPTGGTGPIGWLSATWQQATALLASVGAPADAAATSNTGPFSLISLVKRSLRQLSNIHSVLCNSQVAGQFANNLAIGLTIAAPGVGRRIAISSIVFSYSATPTTPREINIQSAGSALFITLVTTAGPGPININVRAPENTAVTISMDASGTAGNVGVLQVYYADVEVI